MKLLKLIRSNVDRRETLTTFVPVESAVIEFLECTPPTGEAGRVYARVYCHDKTILTILTVAEFETFLKSNQRVLEIRNDV